MKTTLLAVSVIALLIICSVYLKEKQTNLKLSSKVSDHKLELVVLSEQIEQLQLEKESSIQILEKLRIEHVKLQGTLDLQNAELLTAREALNLEVLNCGKQKVCSAPLKKS